VELAHAAAAGRGRDDVLPYPTDEESAGRVRLLMVGINPSPWTVAVNAPFARPGNRFWPSLATAGLTDEVVDASRGLSPSDERMLAERGIGMTNLVARPTARADELEEHELRAGGRRLLERVRVLRPRAVAVVGITAFRSAFTLPRARMGAQDAGVLSGWPGGVPLWVVPNPSGLNAHETVDSLAEWWRKVCAASAPSHSGVWRTE
jgi:TDG/mug DNA glycosylase family protein